MGRKKTVPRRGKSNEELVGIKRKKKKKFPWESTFRREGGREGGGE